MKKVFMSISILLFTTLVMGGGNTGATLSPVAKISNASCKADKVYIEQDAGLMWQDQAYSDAEDGAFKRGHSIEKSGKHRHAIHYCRTLNYGGYTDWRLPTSEELSNVHAPQDNPFVYHRGSDFWSSTPATENRYYVVFTADAIRYARKSGESNYIRCVRCLSEGYIFSGTETVK